MEADQDASLSSQALLDADKATLDQAKAKLAEAEAGLETEAEVPVGRDDAVHAAAGKCERTAQPRSRKRAMAAGSKEAGSAFGCFCLRYAVQKGEYITCRTTGHILAARCKYQGAVFVPGLALPPLPAGAAVKIEESGGTEPIAAHITYISPQAEYSPPELYNRDNRDKLLFMLEATPDAAPERIHPGLPVDVTVGKQTDGQ